MAKVHKIDQRRASRIGSQVGWLCLDAAKGKWTAETNQFDLEQEQKQIKEAHIKKTNDAIRKRRGIKD